MIETDFNHPLPDIQLVKGRHPFIVDLCRNQRVLHIGCVDTGLMEERFANNELLHQKLDLVSEELYGVDINVEGIKFLSDKGFKNLYAIDLCAEQQREQIKHVKFDIIILSEVIEHLNNPGQMLESIKTLMKAETKLMVSVPNAFSAENIWHMMNNTEFVHPDHNYYFSHVTFKNLLQKCGLETTENYLYSFNKYAFQNREKSAIKRLVCYLINRRKNSSALMHYLKLLYWDGHGLFKKYKENHFYKNIFPKSAFFADGLIAICQLKR